MSRSLFALLLALAAAACEQAPSPSGASPLIPTQSPLPSPTVVARLSVSGAGELCGPWWRGCGAVFAVEPANWRLPDDWASSPDDTPFEVLLDAGSDGPSTVTGIRRLGQERLGPGSYRFVVIMTMTPDSAPSGPVSFSLGCTLDWRVPQGTRAVDVEVAFGPNGSSCTIDVSMDPTPVPGST